MNPLAAAGLYCLAFVTDVVWARWSLNVAEKREVRAACYAAAITVCGFVNVEAWVHNPLYVIPIALGCASGSYFAVKRSKQRG